MKTVAIAALLAATAANAGPATIDSKEWFAYAELGQWTILLSHCACPSVTLKKWKSALFYSGHPMAACWQPHPDNTDFIKVCYVYKDEKGAVVTGTCTGAFRESFIDTRSLPRRAF